MHMNTVGYSFVDHSVVSRGRDLILVFIHGPVTQETSILEPLLPGQFTKYGFFVCCATSRDSHWTKLISENTIMLPKSFSVPSPPTLSTLHIHSPSLYTPTHLHSYITLHTHIHTHTHNTHSLKTQSRLLCVCASCGENRASHSGPGVSRRYPPTYQHKQWNLGGSKINMPNQSVKSH